MENNNSILLSQIPLSDILVHLRQIVKEELAIASPISASPSYPPPATIQELCEYLRVTEPTILRWRKKGKIPSIEIGTSIRFNLSDVLKSLAK